MEEPRTPAEYTEAIRRLIAVLVENWGDFDDGDGTNLSDGEDILTKTDMFLTIAGCCDCALDSIKDFNKFIICSQVSIPS